MTRDVIEILTPFDSNEAVQRMKIDRLKEILAEQFEFMAFGRANSWPAGVLINSLYINYDATPALFPALQTRSQTAVVMLFVGDVYTTTPPILQRMSTVVDVFLTPTPEMRDYISAFVDKRVEVLLDPIDFGLDASVEPLVRAGPPKVVWFGYPESYNKSMSEYQKCLIEMHQNNDIEYHIVTRHSQYGRAPECVIHEYVFDRFLSLLETFDICVASHMPLDLSASTLWKSENKAVLAINRGLPTVASRTPAYTRLLDQCGLSEYLIGSRAELAAALRRLSDPAERRRYLDQSQTVVLAGYSARKMAEDWARIYHDARAWKQGGR
jgi:hypothetical protein